MAEVFAQFDEPVVADGIAYRAQAVGAPMKDGLWEGWLEFIPLTGGTPQRSPRETTQPNRADTEYWATGLTPVYLEGALRRALHPLVRKAVEPPVAAFDRPAEDIVTVPDTAPAAEPVLDPFSVYQKSEALLRNQLSALSAWHLVNIIRAYELNNESPAVLNRLSAAALIERIVVAVRNQLSVSR